MATLPTISEITTTSNSAVIEVEPGTMYQHFELYIKHVATNVHITSINVSSTVIFSRTITKLQPETVYAVNIGCKNSAGGGVVKWAIEEGGKTFTTKAAQTRPEDWEWWSTVARDQPIAFTANEWKAFYDKIDEFRVYKGTYAWPNFVPVERGYVITAKMIQEVLAAIQPITTAPMPPIPVAGKTVITADYFNQIRDYLNSVT